MNATAGHSGTGAGVVRRWSHARIKEFCSHPRAYVLSESTAPLVSASSDSGVLPNGSGALIDLMDVNESTKSDDYLDVLVSARGISGDAAPAGEMGSPAELLTQTVPGPFVGGDSGRHESESLGLSD